MGEVVVEGVGATELVEMLADQRGEWDEDLTAWEVLRHPCDVTEKINKLRHQKYHIVDNIRRNDHNNNINNITNVNNNVTNNNILNCNYNITGNNNQHRKNEISLEELQCQGKKQPVCQRGCHTSGQRAIEEHGECYEEGQKGCHRERQRIGQTDCQTVCQRECQTECQRECQRGCQKEWQEEWKGVSTDAVKYSSAFSSFQDLNFCITRSL